MTRSVLTEQHPDVPFVVLDDWSQFRSEDFSPALYEQLMRAWDPDSLHLDRYLSRVRQILEQSRP